MLCTEDHDITPQFSNLSSGAFTVKTTNVSAYNKNIHHCKIIFETIKSYFSRRCTTCKIIWKWLFYISDWLMVAAIFLFIWWVFELKAIFLSSVLLYRSLVGCLSGVVLFNPVVNKKRKIPLQGQGLHPSRFRLFCVPKGDI